MSHRHFWLLGILLLITAEASASQDPLVGQWQVDGRVFEAIQIADREARSSMSLLGLQQDASYLVSDTGETFIVAITQSVEGAESRCVEIRIRKSDNKVLFCIRRDQPMTFEKFRTEQGVRKEQ